MDNTIASIARTLGYDVDALNLISQNVANMQTPGYRAEHLTRNFAAGLPQDAVALDLSNGSVRRTGQPLDLAVQGNAFFTVDVGGQTLLTRAGQFHVDGEGRLVDASGHPVLGQSGPIAVSGAAIHILTDGQVKDGDRVTDRLQIVTVNEPQKLQSIGGGLYAYAGTSTPWRGTLQVGALEEANVDPGSEMVHLMEITRHAQSLQHALRAYDEVLQTGINHLGDNG